MRRLRARPDRSESDPPSSSPSAGRTGTATSGARSASRRSRGYCEDRTTVPRSCCSAGTSATTPSSLPTASPKAAGYGSPVGHSTREAHVGADTKGTSVDAHARRDLASREADDGRAEPPLDLPDVAWISGRDGIRALGDVEDEAARYHPARHELTINADFVPSPTWSATGAGAIREYRAPAL
jgi:hypothetical protein